MNILKKLLAKRILLVTATIGISICNIAVSLWWNVQISGFINSIQSNEIISCKSIGLAVATILISMILAYLISLCSGWTCETIAHDLRMGYAKHFTNLSISEIENLSAGEQLSRLQNEIGDITNFLRTNLFLIVDDTIKFICTFSWLLYLNPKLIIFSNIPTLVILCYITCTSKIIGKAAKKSQQANAQMNGFADSLITIFPIMRLFDANQLILEKYNGALKQWEDASITEENRRATFMSLSALLSCLPLLLLILIGGIEVMKGYITIGTLYIFINLSGNVSGIMNNMPGRIALFRRFIANMERIEQSVKL